MKVWKYWSVEGKLEKIWKLENTIVFALYLKWERGWPRDRAARQRLKLHNYEIQWKLVRKCSTLLWGRDLFRYSINLCDVKRRCADNKSPCSSLNRCNDRFLKSIWEGILVKKKTKCPVLRVAAKKKKPNQWTISVGGYFDLGWIIAFSKTGIWAEEVQTLYNNWARDG